MNERQLKSFIMAADVKSFSRAAENSFVSTPAFVQQINLLEENLGFSLFHRSTRGVKLTEAGKIFYNAAVQILSLYNEAKQKGLALQNQGKNILRIGCPPSQFPEFVSEACKNFQEKNPAASLEFVFSPLGQSLQDIRTGKIDLCFMAEPDASLLTGLYFYSLADETFSFCMNKNHPLSKKILLEPDDLKNFPILCGKYEYLKRSFSSCLPTGTIIKFLPSEYDMSTQSRSMLSDELIIIHSHWSNHYAGNLKVIPSNIYAGKIGAVSVQPTPEIVKEFLKFLPNQ